MIDVYESELFKMLVMWVDRDYLHCMYMENQLKTESFRMITKVFINKYQKDFIFKKINGDESIIGTQHIDFGNENYIPEELLNLYKSAEKYRI